MSPRSDAQRNRERVVAAALAAVRREGVDVPLSTVAADAGVGIGTLYRHFATREELIDELAHRSFERLLDHLARAEEGGGTAVDVLRRFLLDVVDDRDRLVLPSTSGPRVAGPRARALQRRLHAGLRDLLARGHEDGTVLREVDVWDVAWLGATLSAPAPGTRGWRTTAARLLDTYLDGLGVRRIDP